LGLQIDALFAPPGDCRSSVAESCHPGNSVDLSLPIEWSEFRIFENAQSATSGRQFEEILIFPHEIQQNITRVDAKQKEKKEDAFSNNANCQEHRHKSESTNACSDQGKDTACPIEQEQLESGISNFVNQQDAQRFRGADQKAERFCFVSNDELTMRHIWIGENEAKFAFRKM
jgi:hypothetical protein